MQFNAGLERLDDIRIGNERDNESHEMAMSAATVNKFIMYSILDEFKLNDSTMPPVLSAGGNSAHKPGYIGTGFISHIENETTGLVYIVDVTRTPDTLVLFGAKPKRLTHLPEYGEIFGYLFKEKYLVRAVRVQYESGVELIQKQQYSAWLMDIGCMVRIDVTPTLCDHYEVTEVAKTTPSYAKHYQLVRIPDRTTVYDLLHSRIQYKMIFSENGLGFANVLSAGVNPFATNQQNEWNFYMHFFGDRINALSWDHINKQSQPIEKTSAPVAVEAAAPTVAAAVKRVQQRSKNTNPFLYGAYEIESIPMKPLIIAKSNPFYSESMENLYETSLTKQKFVNFKLNKLLNIGATESSSRNKIDNHTIKDTNAQQTDTIIEKKILNGDTCAITDVIETTVHSKQSAQHVDETITVIRQQKHDETENRTVEGDQQQQQQQQMPVSNIDLEINDNKSLKHNVTVEEPIKSSEPEKLADQKTHNGLSTSYSIDFLQPENLPRVGDTIKILYQAIESLETFYATVVDDPQRDMAVHEFSEMLNSAENTQHFESYGYSTPKLYDKVLAMYEDEYYRAQVIGVIDEHSFQVFYVDYGNCAKVRTAQLFKYDNKWDKYPVYALRFRINGIEETNPWDYVARGVLEQILISDCDAAIVRIQYCEKTKRTTYVVDLFDENGLNVAETLVNKNMAIITENRPKKQLKHS